MTRKSALQQIIAAAMKKYPNLDPRGLGPHRSPYPRNQHSFDTVTGRFQIGTAISYLAEHESTRMQVDAYRIKHSAESWGRANGLAPYVSTGAMIVAMVFFEMQVR